MSGERRGTGLLIFGALALAGVAGAVAWWATHRDQQSSLTVFHYLPGPAPLQIKGMQPMTPTDGEDMIELIDPRLLDLLRETIGGGELRWVSEMSTSYGGAVAVLLQNPPTAPLRIDLIDRRAAVYVEQGSGLAVIPEKAPLLGVTITLTPDQPLRRFTFSVLEKNAGRGGSFMVKWW